MMSKESVVGFEASIEDDTGPELIGLPKDFVLDFIRSDDELVGLKKSCEEVFEAAEPC